ncbi:TetR/AcrR family transcriptional regulator [Duganella sp. FT3S]|uniref:TetR/AcrR family transcriptional regulator n=1 Tax=Rugamonas fusca TaxID=2758568 RepID=A0A7W2EH90_9BURK|nr:TetR/AcrR family transcriptional regulator [Rugamonas fusca]MBA5605888.1 TetR/AcrR family transcriptional regulator [Rugamonas fusca]
MKITTAAEAAKGERVYRGASNEQRVSERRQRLLAAAIHCFGTHGYHHTTLKMLCAEAGLTERYFYESFSNFDELLCSAYNEAADTILAKVTAKVARAAPNPHDRMLAALDAYLAAVAADKARARLVLMEIEGASEAANATYRHRLDLSTDLIEQVICADLPARPANGLSPRLLSGALLGAIYQTAKNWALADFKPARTVLVKNLLAMGLATAAVWQGPAAPIPPAATRRRST